MALESTKAAAESDISALKASFTTQKQDFKIKIESMDRENEEVNQNEGPEIGFPCF